MAADIQAALDLSASIRAKTASKGDDAIAPDPFFEVDPIALKVLTYAMARRKNVYIVGETGCGKSSVVSHLAALNGAALEPVSMTGETSVDNVVGKLLITENNGQAVTSVALGPALRAYSEGKILLLEEFDHTNPDVLVCLHRMMEVQSKFYICDIGTRTVFKKHPNFMVIATANGIGWGEEALRYAGIKPMNQATMRRWELVLKMKYLSADKEALVVHNKTGISKPVARKLADFGAFIRSKQNDPSERIAGVISTGCLIEWAEAIQGMDIDPVEAAAYTWLGKMSESDQEIVQRALENEFK